MAQCEVQSTRKGINYCNYKNCNSNSKSDRNLAFFPISSMKEDPERRKMWLRNIGRSELIDDRFRYVLVCSKHFESEQITNESSKRWLAAGAVPIPISLYETQKTITDNLELLYSLGYKHLNKPLNQMLQIYAKVLEQKVDCVSLYADEFKNIVLRLYYEATPVYAVLQSSLSLPPIYSIPKLVTSKREVINDNLIKSLKAKVSLMSREQVFCTLCVSLVKLKRRYHFDEQSDIINGTCTSDSMIPAKYALVAMARGIFDEWQHLVPFEFLATLESTEISRTWIHSTISKLFEIGLNVKLVISDIDDYLIRSFAQKVNITATINYYGFFINEKKIFCLFDGFHLLQIIYNDLKNIDSDSSTVVQWEHILKFYEIDNSRVFRLSPHLTETHLNPLNTEADMKKLQDVAEILSLDIANGLSTFVELGLLEKNALETAKFIKVINILLESSETSDNKSKNIFPEIFFDTGHAEQMIELLSKFDLSRSKSGVVKQYMNCCLVTLKNLPLLHRNIAAETKAVLETKHLNQDPLVDFLDKARFRETWRFKDPTPKELLDTIKNSLVLSFKTTKPLKDSENIDKFTDLAMQITYLKDLRKDKSEVEINDYSGMDFHDVRSIIFVASFLMEKVHQKHKSYSKRKTSIKNSRVFCERKMDKSKHSIVIPNDNFIELVISMDKTFVSNFNAAILSKNVIKTLIQACHFTINQTSCICTCLNAAIPSKNVIKTLIQASHFTINQTSCICTCFPEHYIKNLFFSLRVYYTIKMFNRKLYDYDIVTRNEIHLFVARALTYI